MVHPSIVNLITGLLIGYLTKIEGSWRLSKHDDYVFKAPWTPPGAVFGIVWTFLYIITGIVQKKVGSAHKHLFYAHFVIQNFWPICFFGLGWYVASVGVLALIIILALIIFSIIPKDKRLVQVAWGFYIMWLVFAFSLNMYSSTMAYKAGFGIIDVDPNTQPNLIIEGTPLKK